MELVYLWVEKYKNIENQGFNFSPRFECKYDENSNELNIDKNDDFVSIFPDNINITAIVGENGSGKSNVISIISKILFDKNLLNKKFILLININKKLETITNKTNIKSTFFKKEAIKIDYYLYSAKEQYKPKVTSLTPLLKEISISTEIQYPNNEEKTSITNYNKLSINNSTIGEMITDKFIKDYRFNLTSFMYMPTRIRINNINLETIFTQLINEYNNGYSTFSGVDMDLSDKEQDRAYKDMRNQSWAIHDELESLFEKIDYYHKFLIVSYIQNFGTENYYEFHNKNFLINELNEQKYFLSELDFTKYFKEEEKFIDSFDEKERNIYFKKYKEFFNFDFIDSIDRKFSNLSHGEQTIFGQMLNLYYYSKKTEYKNLIFLLDEPELSLHPEWQRKYLNEMINLLKKESIKYNILLTSHSPFILSDLQKENIIFLKNGKQDNPDIEQTFGANIHTLLSHGFFMEGGLMGEFAKEKINDVILYLNEENSIIQSIKEAQRIINIIGEPVLKSTLQNMLNEKQYPDSSRVEKLKKEKERIEKEIEELEEKSNAHD